MLPALSYAKWKFTTRRHRQGQAQCQTVTAVTLMLLFIFVYILLNSTQDTEKIMLIITTINV